MKMIETLAPLTFGPGAVLKLNDGQAALRAGRLRYKGGGLYETLAEIQFKKGETFGFDGVMNKAMLELVNVDGQPGKPAPAAKPKDGKPIKFLLPKAGDTPDAVAERLSKAAQARVQDKK